MEEQTSRDINVWVGKIAHGSYHTWCKGTSLDLSSPNYCQGGCLYWDDFRNDENGIQWIPTNLIPLDEVGSIGNAKKNDDYCNIPNCEGKNYRGAEITIEDGDIKAVPFGCWQNNYHLWPTSQLTSSYDAPLFFECSGGPLYLSMENSSAITSIYSKHSNDREDRVWTFGCTPLSGGPARCEWTDYINAWDAIMDYTAPDNCFISGFASYHSNDKEDRRWKVKICEQRGKCCSECEWTEYVNGWDGILDLQTEGKVISGIYSIHSNNREDRRWKFLLCNL
ncbi:hypothetical protein ACFL4L_07105, partial [bacterium]